ncbi:S1C family serine protease [Blattabacterium cuenoti]|uniref:S1C family serine protease n=1 Tax=Blattabacterium cuenoti TaxID=1653831 RepID=UPI00163B8940|nr:trypsin-like peptidase domain-containing protein [Blattabacterium cuenoti]
MKKIIFYIILTSFISSVISIAAYKKYLEKESFIFPYNTSSTIKNNRRSFSSLNNEYHNDFTKVVEKTVHSVVNVRNFSKNTNNYNFDPFEFFFGFPNNEFNRDNGNKFQEGGKAPIYHGSGVIISSDGYIVTNHHVIKNSYKIEVTLNDQRIYKARLVGTDPSTDVALLKIEEKNLPFVYFSDSNKVKVGEWVLAIGNPFDLNSTVTAGIISAKNRSLGILREENISAIESFFQTDAAVNPGNSGGALLNTNGELIGINTAISSSSGNFIGYSFAAPSNLVLKVVQDIKKYGEVKRAFLGIKGMDLSKIELLKFFNKRNNKNVQPQSGFLVGEVFYGGSAYEAGIKKGDIIKSINNSSIRNVSDLSFIIGIKRPGDYIKIIVLRDKTLKSFNVLLKSIYGTDDKTKENKSQTKSTSNLLNYTWKSLIEKYHKYFNIFIFIHYFFYNK